MVCFEKEKHALWIEGCIRGWLAAILDFPRCKSAEDVSTSSLSVPDALRAETCCIPLDDDFTYRQLVVSAWCSSYEAFRQEQISEREKVLMAAALKPMPYDEALVFLRHCLGDGKCAELENAYAEFCAILAV